MTPHTHIQGRDEARICSDCGTGISHQSKFGRCRTCAIRHKFRDPAYRAKMAEANRRRFDNPVYRAASARRIHAANRAAWRHPEKSKRMLAALAESSKGLWQPDVRARWLAGRPEAGRKRHETVMAWCPPAYRDEYRFLCRSKKVKAAEAKRIILAKLSPFERQMHALQNGALVVQVPARGTFGR
jgi:hypothetical protein